MERSVPLLSVLVCFMKRKPFLFGALFAATVVGVHVYNGVSNQSFSRRIDLQLSRVSFLGLVIDLPIPRVVKVSAYFDPATALIGGMGHVFRYWTRQASEYYFYGPARPVQRLYYRGDLYLQSTTSLKKVRYVARAVKDYADRLSQAGVTVVLVPIPSKLLMDGPMTRRTPREGFFVNLEDGKDWSQSVYDEFVKTNASYAVDLLGVYTDYVGSHPNAEVFVPWDYHWSALGAALATQAVVKKLAGYGYQVGTPRLRWVRDAPANYSDQLLAHLQLPLFFLAHQIAFQWREPLYEVESGAPSVSSRVYVAGTSYTGRHAASPFGFGRLLEKSTGAAVRAKGVDGGRFHKGLAYFTDQRAEFSARDVLVWEFPIHDLQYFVEPLPELVVGRSVASSDRCRSKECRETTP